MEGGEGKECQGHLLEVKGERSCFKCRNKMGEVKTSPVRRVDENGDEEAVEKACE